MVLFLLNLSVLGASSLMNVHPKHTYWGSHIVLYIVFLFFGGLVSLNFTITKKASPHLYFSFYILQKTTALFCQHSSLCLCAFQAVTLQEMTLFNKKKLINKTHIFIYH